MALLRAFLLVCLYCFIRKNSWQKQWRCCSWSLSSVHGQWHNFFYVWHSFISVYILLLLIYFGVN